MREYQISAETTIGNTRSKNEDNVFCNGLYKEKKQNNFSYGGCLQPDVLNVVGVFDGMGGFSNGETASGIAVRLLGRYTELIRVKKAMFQTDYVFSKINESICSEGARTSERMGSTVVLWVCENGYARISNLGDSRGYLLRGGTLRQLSVDHTEENSMLELQKKLGMTEKLSTSKHKNVLTQHLGIEEDEFILEPAESELFQVREGDIFLLCSDGLTGALEDGQIQDILSRDMKLEEKKRTLIDAALKNGSRDNITVVLIEI